jgi:hypothetical protein
MNMLNYKDNRVELAMYRNSLNPMPKPKQQPVPDRFFSHIPDNRDQILAQMRKDQEMQLELRKMILPERR